MFLLFAAIGAAVIMETNDFVSLLGITSGVSATLVLICIAIGLTARFRQRTSGQNRALATSAAAAGAPVSVASPTGDGHWSKKVNGNQRRRPASHLNLGDLKIDAEDDENDNPDVIPDRNNGRWTYYSFEYQMKRQKIVFAFTKNSRLVNY